MSDPASDGKTGLGRRLAVLRAALGLEQKDVSQRARVAASAVSETEQGKRKPEPETLDRLLEALRGSPTNGQRADWLIRAVAADTDGPDRLTQAAGLAVEGLAFALEDQARARLAWRTVQARQAEQREALQDWADLKSFDIEDLRKIIEDCPELQTPAFWEILCEESAKVARNDTQKANDLARLALDLAGWMPLADEAQRPAYRGVALAFVANTNRVQGDLPSAKEAFQEAELLWQVGSLTEPALDGTRILDLRASQLRDERRLSEALALLDQALEMGPKGPTARARILLLKAKTHEELKQPEVALDLLAQAKPLLDQEPDPVLVYTHGSILLTNLWLAGHAEEAERRLGEVQRLAAALGNDLDDLRLGWLEARLDSAFGRPLAAIEKLRGVRAGFQSRKIAFDTALVTLELSELLLDQGETAEVKELAAEMLATFAEQEVPQEAEKALRIFCEAAIQETATVELVRRVLGEMERR